MSATPTDEERDAVDALLGSPGSGWDGGDRVGDTHRVSRGGHSAREQRHLLLPALHALQMLGGSGPSPKSTGLNSAPQTHDAADRAGLRLLGRVGAVDPGSIDDFRAHGGFESLRRAMELGPEATIAEIKDAKLLGRG